MKVIISFLRIVFFFILLNTLSAQNNIGVKFFGLSIHPKGEKENAFLMPNKLDNAGYFVLTSGGEIMYERFIYKEVISIKIIQGLYADCASRFGGFSHIGIRSRMMHKGKHSLYGGIGPTLVFRKNWLALEGYVNKNRFKGGQDHRFQYLFLWYGGEFEYKYQLRKNVDFAVSFIPGYPDLMSIALGVSCRLDE